MEASIPTPTVPPLGEMTAHIRQRLSRRSMRVVVANEPRAYREVTAEVLKQLRPDVEFELTDPEGLDEAVSRLLPDMVVCDHATRTVREGVAVWLELYPGGDARSTASVHGERKTIEDVQLSDIVGLVDRATEMIRDRRKE